MNALQATTVVGSTCGRVTAGPGKGLLVLLTPLNAAGDIWDVEFSGEVVVEGISIDEPFEVRPKIPRDSELLQSIEFQPVPAAELYGYIREHFPGVSRIVDAGSI